MQRLQAIAEYIWPREPLAVAFDDQCPVCQRFRRLAASLLPPATRVRLDSAQRPADATLAGLDVQARLQTLHAATPTRVHRGFAAVSALTRRTVLGPLLLPGIACLEASPLGEALYEQINRRRQRCPEGCAANGSADG